ncbi:alpha/beta hydrolase [Butyrivibrio sp. AE2032]|uniref:alpha/beta hydrolase n=1 Tax=Butyrivibrio sp. AE2032 TaxID=1458463 RepID=UPI0006907259|nr:alpha/beta hydrolase [Butyrivibrio sp. AE2032]
MSDIKFLGEDDFLEVMTTENEEWKRNFVTQGSFSNPEGLKFNYYIATPEAPKGAVVIVHGMAEFFGKYREYIWYLFKAGYKVFFLEQRGHGYSEGKAPEHDVIYIDNYSTYVSDLDCFIETVVKPNTTGLELFLIAHSMGGCIGTLYLESHPDTFKAAILSSPMLKMKSDNYNPLVKSLIGLYALLSGKSKKLAPNQKHFSPTPKFEGCSALSRARFDYQFNQRIADPHYQISSASFGWAVASMKATDKAIKDADKLKLPVTVMTAGQDHLISSEGYKAFKAKVPQADIHHYENSRHEIFNADDDSRKRYFADVISTLDGYLEKTST